MVPSFSLAVLLASATLLARADVVPNTPNTGKAGSTCSVSWAADTNSTSNWSNMAIELMTGDNYNMVFLTTVTTGLDGTKDGSYTWTCPEVSPFSAIYFYQFISPAESSNPQWTTRFAISSSSGSTTPPPNGTQPDGESIPWGVGSLVNTAVVSTAPSFAANATTGGSDVPTAAPSSSAASASASVSGSAGRSTTTPASGSASRDVAPAGNTSGAAGAGLQATSTSTGSGPSTASASGSSNAGLGLAVDVRVWSTVFGVISSGMAFAMFL